MYVSMQGSWTIQVKFKENDGIQRRFVISGTNTSADGNHPGTAGSSVFVNVAHNKLWTINIQSNKGGTYQGSITQIKFPKIQAGVYKFDIESNDAGCESDPILDDLILTCSTPVTPNDFLVYGNVSTYGGTCFINPCYPKWVVIETKAALIEALKNPILSDIIHKLYPQRIPKIPNPPDPPEVIPFIPIMINLSDTTQSVGKVANIYKATSVEGETKELTTKAQSKGSKTAKGKNEAAEDSIQFEKSITIANPTTNVAYQYNNIALAQMLGNIYPLCYKSPAPFLTLRFDEYDRSASELAGGPYTGTGNRNLLGNVVTDMNGNYILRFYQSFAEQLGEIANDFAPGENYLVQYRPDLIVSVLDTDPATTVLYESAPYYNIPNLYRLDLCLPQSEIPQGFSCFNGNLIGSLGNVFIGGNQNTSGSFLSTALDRNGYNNHLHSNGKITVHNSQAGFSPVDCAAWYSAIDVKGCMYNTKRKPSDPMISYYTIRYKKSGADWQFVKEAYTHPLFSKRNLPNYNGDPVGPFYKTVKVDGVATIDVPTYKNIQKEVLYDGIDWEYSNLDRYMILNSAIYEANKPGTVYFMVEGYDSAGNLVTGAKDLIALYIDNTRLGFSIDDVWIDADGVNIVKAECNLYRIKDAYLNAPIKVQFKANDQWGFLDNYSLTLTKCGYMGFTPDENPTDKTSGNAIAVPSPYLPNTDANNCPGYNGTAELYKFGDINSHVVAYTPTTGNKWLESYQSFAVFTFFLHAQKRVTNGYNYGIEDSPYYRWFSIYVERLS